ncbi:hypothetical protein IAD21_04404 [Abditibacteriota bacterium]|nr:hypothetical protein IAD21_04404 [Abditibacteriota bacterium]
MKIAPFLALVAATLFVGGTSRADDPKIAGPNSFVRILHAISNSPKVDIYLDGKKKLNDIEFDTLSKYLRIPSGYHSFRITSNNPTRTLVSGSRNFGRDHFYTVGVFGRLNAPQVFAADDTAGRVPYNRALLTVYHLSPGAPAVNITGTIRGTEVLTFARGLRYDRRTVLSVPAVPMTIRVTRANGGVLKTITGVSPRAGRKYAAYIIGNVSRNFKVLLDITGSQ